MEKYKIKAMGMRQIKAPEKDWPGSLHRDKFRYQWATLGHLHRGSYDNIINDLSRVCHETCSTLCIK